MFNTIIRTFICFAAFSFLNGIANASIVFTITSSNGGADTQIQIFGTGTVSSNAGAILNFDNFASGNLFNGPSGINNFSGNVVFTGTDASAGAAYTATFTTLRVDNSPTAGGDDIDLRDQSGSALSFSTSDTYSVNSTITLVGTMFSNFNVGSYASTSSDSDNFGGVSINVNAVPEPTSFLLFGMVIGGLGFRRRKA